MTAAGRLDDLFARSAILLLRRSGLRLGECLDLELGCIADYGPTGTWLRVPLGKLGTERAVPLDSATVAALDAWAQHRVRRGFRNIRATVPCPAGAPKPGKPGPGRPPGSKNRRPAPRHNVGKTTKREPTLKDRREHAG